MNETVNVNAVPSYTLYTGAKMPMMGLGTFGSDKYNADQVSEAVYGAIKSGYRLIDCAAVYQNEDKIGAVLERVMQEGIVSEKTYLLPPRYGMTDIMK
jgi:diketogulonate reductase-like aldo/keto reductase